MKIIDFSPNPRTLDGRCLLKMDHHCLVSSKQIALDRNCGFCPKMAFSLAVHYHPNSIVYFSHQVTCCVDLWTKTKVKILPQFCVFTRQIFIFNVYNVLSLAGPDYNSIYF